MISDFALLLSHEGITLAHRTSEGWVSLGHVSLSDPDIGNNLEALRNSAEDISGGSFSTRIVLPEDQIKYLNLPAADSDTREDVIREALEASTPYLLDELSYDWEEGEDGMHVAAVARDTLIEAEDFAVQYGFNPVSFVSAPENAIFSVEPFFGLTDWAGSTGPDQTEPQAEMEKVRLIERSALAQIDGQEDEGDEALEPDDVNNLFAEDEPEENVLTQTENSDPPLRPSLGGATRGAPENATNKGLRAFRGSDTPISVESVGDSPASPAGISGDDPEYVQPPEWMGDQETDGPDTNTSEAVPWVSDTAPGSHPALHDQLTDEAELMKVFGNRDAQTDETPINPIMITAAAVFMLVVILGGYFGYRAFTDATVSEPEIAESVVETPAESDASDQTETVATETEASSANSEEADRPEDTTPAQPQLAKVSLPEDVTSGGGVLDASPEETGAPEFATEDLGTFEALPPAVAGLGEAFTQNFDEVTDGQAPSPLDQEILGDSSASSSDIAPLRPSDNSVEEVASTLAGQRADLLIGASQDWNTLSEDARRARYAATGIWPVAPEAVEVIASESIGEIFLTSLDTKVFVTDAYALPSIAELLTDKALTTMPNPPAPGTQFERDDRGLIVATSEGALTPDGILVYAAVPPRIPPLAPRPDPQEAQSAARAELAGKPPKLRPDLGAAAKDAQDDAEAIAVSLDKMPRLRPAEIAALAQQAEVVLDNPLAVAQTPFPRMRPSNISAIVYATERASIAAQTTTRVAPTATNVANEATESRVLPLREISLIGVYGKSGDRRALVRLASGRYVKIEVGDRLERGTITAIDETKVYYSRNGQSYVLELP